MRLPNQAPPMSRTLAAITRLTPQSCVGDCIMSYFNLTGCQQAGLDPSTVGGAIACAALKGVTLSPPALVGTIATCGIKCAY
jgi:hypothetical protein